jgi:hypothetical protein
MSIVEKIPLFRTAETTSNSEPQKEIVTEEKKPNPNERPSLKELFFRSVEDATDIIVDNRLTRSGDISLADDEENLIMICPNYKLDNKLEIMVAIYMAGLMMDFGYDLTDISKVQDLARARNNYFMMRPDEFAKFDPCGIITKSSKGINTNIKAFSKNIKTENENADDQDQSLMDIIDSAIEESMPKVMKAIGEAFAGGSSEDIIKELRKLYEASKSSTAVESPKYELATTTTEPQVEIEATCTEKGYDDSGEDTVYKEFEELCKKFGVTITSAFDMSEVCEGIKCLSLDNGKGLVRGILWDPDGKFLVDVPKIVTMKFYNGASENDPQTFEILGCIPLKDKKNLEGYISGGKYRYKYSGKVYELFKSHVDFKGSTTRAYHVLDAVWNQMGSTSDFNGILNAVDEIKVECRNANLSLLVSGNKVLYSVVREKTETGEWVNTVRQEAVLQPASIVPPAATAATA